MGCGESNRATNPSQSDEVGESGENNADNEVIENNEHNKSNIEPAVNEEIKQEEANPNNFNKFVKNIGKNLKRRALKHDFMETIPCKNTFVEPNDIQIIDPEEPKEKFSLEYIYGYRAGGSSMNCLYTNTRKVVYFAASVGIVLDTTDNTQQFFGGIGVSNNTEGMVIQHRSKILCIAIDASRRYVATAEMGRYPALYIWNASDCKLKTSSSMVRLGEKSYMPKAITAIGFSAEGNYISLADNSDERKIYVYTVDEHVEKFKEPAKIGMIKSITWSRTGEDMFCTAGKNSVKFWYPFSQEKKIGRAHV